ncbi:MarR family winged helix-turn-helix transcriptional regulator [Streptomyces sp. NPDC017979]|uniref:MarR family winged helix-turn-helix transcriptional regulator n=1 Tax=Streptomyces sp. NPDC017979 TaxID=3365024 RepID=UPI00379F1C11
MPGQRPIAETERKIRAKLGGAPVHHDQMAMVGNIHRAAAAVRQHVENSVLRGSDLTWTGFVVLWVVWIWGQMETRLVAAEAGISKGTLTGVARTLESRGLVRRSEHPSDGRRVLLALTDEGEELMQSLFPEFNEEEVFVAAQLSDEESRQTADALRRVVVQIETHGEERRRQLLGGEAPVPRRSGRRRAKGTPRT